MVIFQETFNLLLASDIYKKSSIQSKFVDFQSFQLDFQKLTHQLKNKLFQFQLKSATSHDEILVSISQYHIKDLSNQFKEIFLRIIKSFQESDLESLIKAKYQVLVAISIQVKV
jgi:hypothetical protein